jgi:hypothetical protein
MQTMVDNSNNEWDMTNRREFLERVMWASAPFVVGMDRARATERSASPFHAVVIDDRFAASREFGVRLAGDGARLHAIDNGEITDLWLRDIRPTWRRGPVPVAGLTQAPVLFCLEQLAWSHGMRVVFHAEHIVTPSTVSHRVHRCDARLAPLDERALASVGPRWSLRVADSIASYRPQGKSKRVGPTCAGLDPSMPADATLLTSWIIARV